MTGFECAVVDFSRHFAHDNPSATICCKNPVMVFLDGISFFRWNIAGYLHFLIFINFGYHDLVVRHTEVINLGRAVVLGDDLHDFLQTFPNLP